MLKIKEPMGFLQLFGTGFGKWNFVKRSLLSYGNSYMKACLSFEVLNNKGILVSNNYLMCNENKESLNHLFMMCPFTRAIWHGSNLAIRSFELQYSSIKQWVEDCILQNESGEYDRGLSPSKWIYDPSGIIETRSFTKEFCLTLWKLY